MTVTAVIFDFYGTLTPGRTSAEQTRTRIEQAVALGVDPQRFDDELTATVEDRFRGAGGTVEGSLQWIARRLGAAPDAEAVRRATVIRLASERHFGEPRPEAVPVLQALRLRGLRIGLMSDCSAELPTYFAQLPIAPFVDAAVFSFVTGHRKPGPDNYRTCCTGLGVDPAGCLYVGDGGSNELTGARDLGMRAVHLAVAGEAGAIVYGRHEAWDGEVITSLGQVLDLL